MNYYTIQPTPRLAPYVRTFWVYEGEASEAEPYIYRGFADGCTEMVFHYKGVYDQLIDDRQVDSFAAGIVAQTRKFSRFVVNKDWGIFGVYLYPYALTKLFSFPASDFTDLMPDFDTVLGREGKQLEERMLTAADNAARVSIMTEFLESKLGEVRTNEPRMFASISYIIETRGLVNVSNLAKEFFLSNRQFERKFKEFAGFSPKTYSRIIRFQAALKEFGSNKSLTQIAYDCGYYDQPHFINEFKEFSGYSPKAYFFSKTEGFGYLES
ncbi:MAG TPA: helix-turn-helix domain-containing protein [Pyrinomonadaceae bacterium]|nr:helix-turn-helix domain-containing protein [Pyrinomonadaceae bacterium]